MLVVAVSLLATAMVVLGLALWRVQRTSSPSSRSGAFRSARAAAADLDQATEELRAAVDGRADR